MGSLHRSAARYFIADLLILLLLLLLVAVHASTVDDPPFGSTTPVDLGTTLVAIKYRHGVVMGADSRTSQSTYVSHRYATKWVPITGYCFVGRSGSASETQRLARLAQRQAHRNLYRYGRSLSPGQLAHYMASRVYNQQEQTASAQSSGTTTVSLLVAGYDLESQSSRIYSVSSSGALIEEDAFGLAGSGSRYVMGFLDHYCHHGNDNNHGGSPLLDEEDAIQLCRQAVDLAVARDGSSGGPVRIYSINRDGNREVGNISTTTTTTTTTTGTTPVDQNLSESRGTKIIPGFANAEHPQLRNDNQPTTGSGQ